MLQVLSFETTAGIPTNCILLFASVCKVCECEEPHRLAFENVNLSSADRYNRGLAPTERHAVIKPRNHSE